VILQFTQNSAGVTHPGGRVEQFLTLVEVGLQSSSHVLAEGTQGRKWLCALGEP
jgi:hypothetical protein